MIALVPISDRSKYTVPLGLHSLQAVQDYVLGVIRDFRVRDLKRRK